MDERRTELVKRAQATIERADLALAESPPELHSFWLSQRENGEKQLAILESGGIPIGMATEEDLRAGRVPGYRYQRSIWSALGRNRWIRIAVGTGVLLQLSAIPALFFYGSLLAGVLYIGGFLFWGWLLDKLDM